MGPEESSTDMLALAQKLVDQRYMLAEDLESMVELGGRHYDLMSAGALAPQPSAD